MPDDPKVNHFQALAWMTVLVFLPAFLITGAYQGPLISTLVVSLLYVVGIPKQ